MKLKRSRTKFLLVVALLGFGTKAFAQRAKYMAELPKPPKADFYIVTLPPAITAKANADLSDIRIVDATGHAVPYLFGDAMPAESGKQNFIYYKQIPNERLADSVTTFTIEDADESNSTSQFTLIVRNTAVGRTADLSGSDDLKNWYAIKEGITLQKTSDSNKDTYQQLITFPASSYRYYRLKVNNGKHDPVAILAAGIYGSQIIEKPALWPLSGSKFTQKDSAKTSRVWINFNDNYRINSLLLTIAGTRYYRRNARLYEVHKGGQDLLVNTFISSANGAELHFSAKTRQLLLEIDNEDNAPLVVSNVKAWQLQQSLITYLDAGKNYRILFGDTAATAPNYDLRFFADSVRELPTPLTPAQIKENPKQATIQVSPDKGIPTWVIWIAITVVLGLLAILTLKMTQEVGKRNR